MGIRTQNEAQLRLETLPGLVAYLMPNCGMMGTLTGDQATRLNGTTLWPSLPRMRRAKPTEVLTDIRSPDPFDSPWRDEMPCTGSCSRRRSCPAAAVVRCIAAPG